MDLFGDLLNAVTGNANTPANPANVGNPAVAGDLGHPGMVNALLALLGNQGSGGAAGLVQLFEQQGLGHLVSSWIGTGQNLPISPQQVESVLGSGRLAELAQKAGIPPETASTVLASVLPNLIDRLTPTGTLQHSLIEEGITLLRGKIG
ncbi:MAG TPA: YidB family protein [Thermoanaerobaculia bacterium]|nr:YidB family protein [Thermoanaerobaculia bacterium]